MTHALTPHLRLVDLSTNATLAETSNVLDYEISWQLDDIGQISIEVPAGDPGDAATADDLSFATALLRASQTNPLPILLELSLDGGTTYDSRRLVRQPQRSLLASKRTIKESGSDLGDILSTVPIERATYFQMPLEPILNGAAGTLITDTTAAPVGIRGFTAGTDTTPHLAGILTRLPGLDSWPSGARLRCQFTGVVNTATITPPGVPLDHLLLTMDIDSATVQAAIDTLGRRLGGATPDQSHGHVMIDCSDPAVNLSSSVGWSTSAIPRSVVVGHVGTSPHVAFDATGSQEVNETTHARVHLDQATAESDDTLVYAEANMVGGSSRAGFPDGSKITGLTVIDAVTGSISADRDLWTDCCPVLGLDIGGTAGGVYFSILDGQVQPVHGSPALPCHSLAWDKGHGGDRPAALLMGTPYGIFYSEDAPLPHYLLKTTWHPLGNLNADVVRLMVEEDPDDVSHRVVFALVKGSGQRSDGVYRWTSAGGWDAVYVNTAIVDMVTTDFKTFWTVKQSEQSTVYQYSITGTTASLAAGFPLPDGIKAYSLQRVITVDPAIDSIWALGTDGGPAVYYLLNDGGWGSFQNANASDTLKDPASGKALACYRAVGLGVTMDQPYGNSQLANVMLATDTGVYWMPNHLTDAPATWTWYQADMGGLTGAAVKNLTAGEGQTVLGTALNRVFATTEDDLLYSNSTARWWASIKGRNRTDLGPYLSNLTSVLLGDNALPDNMVVSWGSTNLDLTPMTTSPFGLADNTHIHIGGSSADILPPGYVWVRYLDDHLDYQYKLLNLAAHLPGLQMGALPQIQTNLSQDALTASTSLSEVSRRWLQQHSAPQTRLTLESHFENPAAALRSLRPTHKVSLTGTITLVDRSSAGAVVSSQPLHFDGSEDLWVLEHHIRRGPGRSAITTTTLGTKLWLTPISPQDMDTALADQLHAVRTWK